MFTDSLPTNARLSCEMSPSRLQHAIISAFDRVASGARTQRTRRSQSGSLPASLRRHRRQEASMRFATLLLPLLAVLVAPLCNSAQAADYEVGASLVCDTQTQVERFVALFSGDAQAAIDAVNAEEHDPTASALVNVAYLRGSHIGVARNGVNAFQIDAILACVLVTAAGI